MTALVGCDFSSAPSKRNPIALAWGECSGRVVRLTRLVQIDSLEAFADWLHHSDAWLGGFDMPFGLPRELAEQLGRSPQWEACIRHYANLNGLTYAPSSHPIALRKSDDRAKKHPNA